MNDDTSVANERKMTSIFERYLTIWVGLCIVCGILLGKIAPQLAKTLDGMSIKVNDAPVVSIPIAICLFYDVSHHGKNRFCQYCKGREKWQTCFSNPLYQLVYQTFYHVYHFIVFSGSFTQKLYRR